MVSAYNGDELTTSGEESGKSVTCKTFLVGLVYQVLDSLDRTQRT